MAALELDPVFVRALHLLHSKAKDSSDQLLAMVEDAIALRKIRTDGDSRPSSRCREEETKKKDPEKRKLDKIKDESESGAPDVKKAKLESSPRRDERKDKEKEKYRKEKEKQRELEKEKERQEREKQKELEKEKAKKMEEEESESEESSSSDDDDNDKKDDSSEILIDADDFAGILGLSCAVCRGFDVAVRNQLMECEYCRNLFHQECHNPPFTGTFDPRSVWRCSKCLKKKKKEEEAAKKAESEAAKKVKVKVTQSSSSKDSSRGKADAKVDPSIANAFKRTEGKSSTTSSKESSSSGSLTGLQALKASLTKGPTKPDPAKQQPGWKDLSKKDSSEKPARPSDSKDKSNRDGKKDKTGSGSPSGSSYSLSRSTSNSGNGGNGKPTMSGNTMANATKRLQMMKKNAAKQQKESRSVHIK